MDSAKNRFITCIHQHQGIIDRLCAVYYPNAEDQKDARQDVILQVWKAYPNFRNEAKISTWIYRVSLNTILNKRRKERKYPLRAALEEVLSLGHSPPTAVDDDRQLLRQLINTLKDTDKALVILHLEGYQHKEIAQMLHLSATNVSTRFKRIKSFLQKKVKPNLP